MITGFLLTAVPNWTGRLPFKASRFALVLIIGRRARRGDRLRLDRDG